MTTRVDTLAHMDKLKPLIAYSNAAQQGLDPAIVRLERFPVRWNRARFHLTGNARAGVSGSTEAHSA